MAVEYSMKDAFGEPSMGTNLIDFCFKSRYGSTGGKGRLLSTIPV